MKVFIKEFFIDHQKWFVIINTQESKSKLRDKPMLELKLIVEQN